MSAFRAWQADLFLLVNSFTQRLYAYSNNIQGALASRLVAIY